LFGVWDETLILNNSGELKASQHLGLARLASQLSFIRRGRQNGQRHQNQQHQDTGTRNFDGVGETDSYSRWLYHQGIKTDNERKTAHWREEPDLIAATPAAGVVVGYGSYDYREHAMGYLTRGIFCNHQARTYQ